MYAAPKSNEKEGPVERRLAAILAADVVGYSRMMGADEVGTLRRLRAYRGDLIDPAIAARRGRIVKTTGDGLLVEFPSAVDAVACAITTQRALALRNEGEVEGQRLVFRIGINVGDIIIEANDIFGDGVNVAARLETLAQPGGLCISRAVRDQVRDKLPVPFDDLGEQVVKNIARPVRAFGLSPEAIAAAPDLAASAAAAPPGRGRVWIAAGLAALLVAAGGSAWWLARAPSVPHAGDMLPEDRWIGHPKRFGGCDSPRPRPVFCRNRSRRSGDRFLARPREWRAACRPLASREGLQAQRPARLSPSRPA